MSNILEQHLEENIEPNTNRQSYIEQAIQIFQDMKPEDITLIWIKYKDGNKYCLNGLLCRMTGYTGDGPFSDNASEKIGMLNHLKLSNIHIKYCEGRSTFEQMRQEAIQYMESIKGQETIG